MINMYDMQTSFLLMWAINLQKTEETNWKVIPQFFFKPLGKELLCFMATTNSKNFEGIGRIKSKFWQQVLTKWLDNKRLFISNRPNFTKQCLWNNIKITFKMKTLFLKNG